MRAVLPMSMHNLFIYGTLIYPQVWKGLIRRPHRQAAATLRGHQRRHIGGESYPGMVPCKGSQVEGRIVFDLRDAELRRLDRYEGKYYERRRVTVQLADGSAVTAFTYLFRRRYRNRLSNRVWQLAADISVKR